MNFCISSDLFLSVDIEAQILEIQGMKASLVENGEQGVGLDSTGFYDQEIYGGSDSRFAGYVTSIAANEQEDVSLSEYKCFVNCRLSSIRLVLWNLTAPVSLYSVDELGESCLVGWI